MPAKVKEPQPPKPPKAAIAKLAKLADEMLAIYQADVSPWLLEMERWDLDHDGRRWRHSWSRGFAGRSRRRRWRRENLRRQ